jgi:hypothetical protein
MEHQPGALTLSEGDRRLLADWAADCADRTLPLFEARVPRDPRPRAAVDGLRAFARGERRIGELRTLSVRAHEAARDTGNPAAVAAARAAGHAAGTAHMGAHARGAAAYAAIAVGLAQPDDPAARDDETRWQCDRASPAVRVILLRLPPPLRGGGLLGALIRDLYAAVSDRSAPG